MALLLLANSIAVADDVATTNNADLSKLADMDINQLMQIQVSILGQPQSVSQTPAAVSVVTQDDIKRTGAQNIPEALRYVPGLDVAQVDSSQWAVTARGFNDIFADKLLVMQDGRSIYTPLFSGVFWDVQGTMMEDIDRIEVVRGPGATLWGANAMNGVIDIVTKNAEDTQGLLASAGGGNVNPAHVAVRYGGAINSNAFYRVYGTYDDYSANQLMNGDSANDAWQVARGGFRTDWNPGSANTFTFQGDGYMNWMNYVFGFYDPTSPTYSTPIQNAATEDGGNVLGRWTHEFSDTDNFKLQAYYDYSAEDLAVFNEQRNTFDLDFHDQIAVGNRNMLNWGAGYRITADTEKDNPMIQFNPLSENVNLYSAFLQDEIALLPDTLSLTFGSKFEHNDYTGFEFEPGGRLLWTPTKRQTVWASISRAVRTPSRVEESITLNESQRVPVGGGNYAYVPMTIEGNTSFQSEELIAYEAGYRAEPLKQLSLDFAAFYNDYQHIRSEQPTADPTAYYLANDLYGDSYGVEATATWQALSWWRLQPNYTFLVMDMQTRTENPADDGLIGQIEGSSPRHQFTIRSSMDFPRGVTFDTDLRYVDSLQSFQIDSYFELDARLAWQINKNWEVALVGQNLLHSEHPEFGPTYVNTENGRITDIPRSVFLKVTYKF